MDEILKGETLPDESRPYVAVATMEGLLVNVHLGQARQLNIYTYDQGGARVIQTRSTPEPGGQEIRWKKLGDVLKDCKVLLVADAGSGPIETLQESGLKVIRTEGLIEQTVTDIYEGRKVQSFQKPFKCGSGCGGNGTGCG